MDLDGILTTEESSPGLPPLETLRPQTLDIDLDKISEREEDFEATSALQVPKGEEEKEAIPERRLSIVFIKSDSESEGEEFGGY